MKSILKQIAADAYALAALVIFAVYFTLLQWWVIFDPNLLSLPWDNPQWDTYWHVKDSMEYFSYFLLWFNLARLTGYSRPYLRLAYTLCQMWMVFAFIDLQFAGNWLTGTYWDWVDFCMFGAGAVCAILTEWKFRRIESDPIEPGGVYVVSRPPRNWLEWAGSVRFLFSGPVSIYCRFESFGIFYGPSKKSRSFSADYVHNDQFKPLNGQVFRKVDADRHYIDNRFTAFWEHEPWTWRNNCFKMVKDLTRKI